MSETVKVGIEGFKEFRKALKQVGGDLPKATRVAFNKASQVVVDEAKPDVVSDSGAAANSVRAQSTQTASRVSGGSGKAPYYGWLDFGGRVGKYKQISRPYKQDGRYIYAAYFRKRDSGEFQEVLSESLQDVAVQAGLAIEQE